MTKKSGYVARVKGYTGMDLDDSLLSEAQIIYDDDGRPRQVILDGQHYHVTAEPGKGQNVYLVTVDGINFDVEIKRPVEITVEALGFNKSQGQESKFLLAPMPGQVLHFSLQPGDEIREGQDLVTLEAMKMENTLKAPKDGTIKSVFVKQGETVKKGQKLLEIS